MIAGFAFAFLAGALCWYPAVVLAMSAAIPLAKSTILSAAALALAGVGAGAASVRAFRAANRPLWAPPALAMTALTGLLLAHAAGSRAFDLRTSLDPFGGAHMSHDSCAPDVAVALEVLSTKTRQNAKDRSPYVDVILDVEASMPLMIDPAGEARDEKSGMKLPVEVEPKTLPKGKGRLTLRLMDADGLRKKGLVLNNLQVYLRSPDCPAQPRATLVPRLEIPAK